MVNRMESVVESDVKRELEDKRRSLNELIETVDNFKNSGESDDAVENCLTRFLMLRACGYVEHVFRRSVCFYVERKAGVGVRELVDNARFARGLNPKRESVKEILKPLDSKLYDDFLKLLGDGDDLDSLVKSRNKIAHGGSDNCTKRRSIEQGKLAIKIGDWFLKNCMKFYI